MPPGHDAFIGTLLKGKYRIDSVLGEGGMGVVYRGSDTSSQQPIAIKTLQPSAFHSPKARERFQREATLANRLNNPGIARVLDFGIEDDTPYLVMELVEGVELTEVIDKEGPQRPARAIVIMRQLLTALSAAHAQNMVHRDIKPANIRLVNYVKDGPIVLKVLDFGLAKEIGQEQGRLTSTGAVMGTPLYLAPEQAMDSREIIDGRADQYAAGIVLYELLSGQVPFQSQSVAGLLMSHVARPPPPLPKTIPEPLRRVVMRMLSKAPADRYLDDAAADQALAACEKICAAVPAIDRSAMDASAAPLPLEFAPSSTLSRRQAAIVGGVGAAVTLGLLAAGMLYVKGRHVDPPAQPPAATVTAPAPPPEPAKPVPAAVVNPPVTSPPSSSPPRAETSPPGAAARRSGKGKKGAVSKPPASAVSEKAAPSDPYAVPVAR